MNTVEKRLDIIARILRLSDEEVDSVLLFVEEIDAEKQLRYTSRVTMAEHMMGRYKEILERLAKNEAEEN